MKETLKKEVQKIYSEFKQIKNEDCIRLYILQKRLITVIEIGRFHNFDRLFSHIYSEAKDLVKEPPREGDNQGCGGLKRELDYLLPSLINHLEINEEADQ